jgi:magnesium transporter
MTAILPGHTVEQGQASMPVTFVCGPARLVTVRHHAPRPFETFPQRAAKSASGCATPAHVFLGLIEEILGRQADHLEGVGRALDESSRTLFDGDATQKPKVLQEALVTIGAQGEILSRVRLGLMTLDRALGYFAQTLGDGPETRSARAHVKARHRDLQALEIHADFLSGRLSQATDATLGMVNLAQNMTVRIVSVVAALFLPPTLIASVYGMNFQHMPELGTGWGYPASLLLMAASAGATYLFFKWKNWL